METPLPTSQKLKSLNVEESRTRRLERQQARLRDRGGIFRPENRNNNLFDILVQAAHRKSPAKGRGRSRSRSVSPRKKAVTITNTQTKSSKRSTRIREDVKDPTLAKGSKEKKKQVKMDNIEDKSPAKSKPRSRKVASVQKKGKTNAPRQRARKTSIDETPEQTTIPAHKTRDTKPKGRRKKTDAIDDRAKSPLLKGGKPKATKRRPISQNALADVSEVIEATQKTQPTNDALPLKFEKVSRTARHEEDRADDPIEDSTSQLTECRPNRPNKRKAEIEAVGIYAELRPAKRQPPSMSRSGATVDEEPRTVSKKCALVQSDPEVTNTIDNAADNLPQLTDDENSSYPRQTAKKNLTSKLSKGSVLSNSQDNNPEPNEVSAPKTKGKRFRAQVEFDDETINIRSTTKKLKTSSKVPPKDMLQSTTIPQEDTKKLPGLKPNKRKQESDSVACLSSTGDLATTSLVQITGNGSRKRRDLETVVKKKAGKTKATKAPRNKRGKYGPHTLARAMQKLDAQCDDCVPDDEPDPIDFLS